MSNRNKDETISLESAREAILSNLGKYFQVGDQRAIRAAKVQLQRLEVLAMEAICPGTTKGRD